MEEPIYPSITPTNIESVLWNERIYEDFVKDFRRREEEWSAGRSQRSSGPQLDLSYVYKYRAIDPEHPELSEEIFGDQKVWSPSLESLNDPLEAAFVFGKAVPDPVVADAVKMMMKSNWYGCICFSRDPVCVQMWAHYASSHSGYCVEYYRPDSFLLSAFCRPVLYRRNMPELTDKNDIDRLFWTKSEIWEYEAEWRLRYPRANAHTAPGLLRPHGVVFGLRTPDSVKKLIRKCAGNIRFGQIVPAREPYRIKVEWEGATCRK
jgi:hypothetical protein